MKTRIFLVALLGDLKGSLHSWCRNPGFTLLAVAVMAVGIGANTAMFSVVNAVVLKPLAYPDPDRIVTLKSIKTKMDAAGQRGTVSPPNFHDWHDQSTAFDGMASYGAMPESVMVGSEAVAAAVTNVSPDFFRVFGVQPMLGRLFLPEEGKRGGLNAVLISHAFWQNHFGGNPRVLGQTVRMHGRAVPVIGVMPPGFYPTYSDMWIPANTVFGEGNDRSNQLWLVVARLKSDVSLEQAQAQMTSIATGLERQYPASNRDTTATVTRMRDQMVGPVKPTLYMLLGGVAVLLLIACANIANLLLAKAMARTQEMAVRIAMGATRGRIVSQLLTESLLLALVSGTAGLALAWWGTRALVRLAPPIPRLAETGIDAPVLAFTLIVSVLASVMFGLAPAIATSRVDLNGALKQGSRRGVLGGGAGSMQRALVVAEIALSLVLLVGASLLAKSFVALSHIDLGFRPENLLVMQITLPRSDYTSLRRSIQIDKLLLAEIAALPGISAVGSLRLPPGRTFLTGDYWVDHRPGPEGSGVSAPQAVFTPVASGTFAALGIPLRHGRDFNDSDTEEAPFAAVINEALARKSFPGRDPIGRIIFGSPGAPVPMRIVGVVGDVRQSVRSEASPEIYIPYTQHPYWAADLAIVVRTAAEPGSITEAMRKKARQLAPEAPVKFTTAESTLIENIAVPRFRTVLLGIFSSIALCLAIAGIYGVISYVAGQRVGEIGLRMALGASPADVLWLVLREGLALVSVGLALGLAVAVAATRLLTSLLFEVKPTDPVTFAGVAILMGLVSLGAACVPALRATKVDPLAALRQE